MRSVVEVPLRVTRGKIIKTPTIEALESGRKIGSGGGLIALVPCDIALAIELQEWSGTNFIRKPKLMACWSFEIMHYRCEREFMGVAAYLATSRDVVHFKLAWADYLEHDDDGDEFMKQAQRILS